ncbi:MAG: hypothetical protein ABII90_04740, partial [Bacteroidota bacterium]
MKKLIFILFLVVPFIGIAQTSSENLKKYWYYRIRLINDFMKVGPDQGESIPAEVRQINGKIKWGDATMYLGWYIGVLATEYLLLDVYDQNTFRTKKELYYALNAYERIDMNAEPLYYDDNGNPGTPTLNGFFIRDDVPADFLTKNNNENLAHFNQELTDVSEVNSITSDYIREVSGSDPCIAEMSQDNVYQLLIGFALVNRFIDDGVTYNGVALKLKARVMADLILKHVRKDNWKIKNPVEGEDVCRGWKTLSRSFGLAAAGKKITGIGYQNVLSEYWYYIWQLAQTFVNPTSGNNHHKAVLAAIGDSWRIRLDGTIPKTFCLLCPNSTYQGIANSTAWA